MIEIDKENNIVYDESKDFEKQSKEFKAYAIELYSNKVREVYQATEKHYPDLNEDGTIPYIFEDELLSYEFVRIQKYPKSTDNRAVKKIIYNITKK